MASIGGLNRQMLFLCGTNLIIVVICNQSVVMLSFMDMSLASLTSKAHLSGAMEKQTSGLLEGFALLLAATSHGAGALLLVLFLWQSLFDLVSAAALALSCLRWLLAAIQVCHTYQGWRLPAGLVSVCSQCQCVWLMLLPWCLSAFGGFL